MSALTGTENNFSAFDIAEFTPNGTDGPTLKNVIALAQHAETAERYEDMCELMKVRVESFPEPLDTNQRNLLSVAYKNVIGARRASWRTISSELDKNNEEHKDNLNKYKEVIETELEKISQDVLQLLTDKLIKNEDWDKKILVEYSDKDKDTKTCANAQVFYLKMAGDYYRYLNESLGKPEHKEKTETHYKRAMDIAKVALAPTHPIRLGLALNYSVCFYEILKQPTEACNLAKDAFDEAISKLDELEEADYKDSTLIMQLLRDNLTLWTTTNETSPDGDLAVEEME